MILLCVRVSNFQASYIINNVHERFFSHWNIKKMFPIKAAWNYLILCNVNVLLV